MRGRRVRAVDEKLCAIPVLSGCGELQIATGCNVAALTAKPILQRSRKRGTNYRLRKSEQFASRVVPFLSMGTGNVLLDQASFQAAPASDDKCFRAQVLNLPCAAQSRSREDQAACSTHCERQAGASKGSAKYREFHGRPCHVEPPLCNGLKRLTLVVDDRERPHQNRGGREFRCRPSAPAS